MKYSTIKLVLKALLLLWIPLLYSNTNAQNPEDPYKRLLKTQREYEAAVASENPERIAEVCYLLGKRHIALGNYPKAQEWLLKSLAIREPHGPSEGVGKIYLRMSEIQSILRDQSKTMYYARVALQHFEKARIPAGKMSAFRSISEGFRLNWDADPDPEHYSQLDSAIHYHFKALRIAKQINSPVDVAFTYQGLGLYYFARNNPVMGDKYTRLALTFYEKHNNAPNIIALSTDMAFRHLRKGERQKAWHWLEKASRRADQISPSYGVQISLRRALAWYYQETQNWQEAFNSERKADSLNTSEFSNYRHEALKNIEAVFESEKKSVQLAEQRKQLALQQRNLTIQNRLNLITGVALLFAIISACVFYVFLKRYKHISNQNAILIKEQSHRTKNNIQSILDLLNLQLQQLDDPIAKTVLEESLLRTEAIALINQKLYKSEDLVDISLLSYIPDLIGSVLRSYRLQTTIVEYLIEDISLPADKATTLGLIVNELATNACKYGLKNTRHPTLFVTCQLKDEKLTFTFGDNGPGMDTYSPANTFGLKLIGILLNKIKATGEYLNQNGCHFKLSFPIGKTGVNLKYSKFQIPVFDEN